MPSPTKSLNQRDRIRDPREDILLETNFEDDGILTHAYNNNPYNGGTAIHNRRRSTYRSDHSLDRYTERGGDEGNPITGFLHTQKYVKLSTNFLALNRC